MTSVGLCMISFKVAYLTHLEREKKKKKKKKKNNKKTNKRHLIKSKLRKITELKWREKKG